jgi:UDP-glucose 4-epimerase
VSPQPAWLDRYCGVRVAVLGASGFIGRWVARRLTDAGADLLLIVRSPQASAETFRAVGVRGTIVNLDLRDGQRLERLFERVRPSITFNLAGYGVDPSERDDREAERTNRDLVVALCQAVAAVRDPRWSGAHIVHTGSALEYGVANGMLAEDTWPMPTTVYGRSKLEGTRALAEGCATMGLRGVTARLFNVYGPGEHRGRLLPTLLEAARNGTAVDLTAGQQRRDFTYVDDVADGLLRLGVADPPPGSVVNLATGHLTSVKEFVLAAARLLAIPSEHLRFAALPMRVSEMTHENVSIDCLTRLLAWHPGTTIEEGIIRTRDFSAAS